MSTREEPCGTFGRLSSRWWWRRAPRPPGAAQTPPSTLTGESLTGQPQVTSNCNTAGDSTISYSVTGVAGPPYVGTFTETGVVTIGPQPLPGFAVPATSFSATFVIDSPPNRVTGTKRLAPPGFLATGLGFCTDFLKSFGIEAFYDARIETPEGVFLDRGRTGVALNEPGLAGQPADFNEFFVSDLFQTIPAPPAAKVTGGGSIEGTSASTGFVVQRKERAKAPPDTVDVSGTGFGGTGGALDGNAQVRQE